MKEKELNELIDKGLGTVGPLNIPSFWMKKILLNIVDWIKNISSSVNKKQDSLISGKTIKTINGVKLLGSGNLKLGFTKVQVSTDNSMTLSPNIYYRNTNTNLNSLYIDLNEDVDPTVCNEYFVEFTTRSSGTTVYLPSSISWVNGEFPVFENGATYQISIVNNLGVVTKFK